MIEVELELMVQKDQHNHCGCNHCKCMPIDIDRLKNKYARLLYHLNMVSNYCGILAERLIDNGQYELAHQLFISSRTHDLSKFYEDEWQYLCEYNGVDEKSPELKKAIYDHVTNNSHHPESWEHKGGIHGMDDLALAEMMADWLARGEEFNKPIADFLLEKAFKKYNFTKDDKCFKKMDYYHILVTDKPIFGEKNEDCS